MQCRQGLSQGPQVVSIRSGESSRLEISPQNTTLIGDYTSVAMTNDSKWLVQAQGNATFSSTLTFVKDGMLIMDRKYIFFQLGGNQVRGLDSFNMHSVMLELVITIRNANPESRIFFIGVLPRIVDNEQIKPYIMKFNRKLAATANEIDVLFEKVKFLPVHLKFINGTFPRVELFDVNNTLLLNNVGVALFKQAVFKLAGFVKNPQ